MLISGVWQEKRADVTYVATWMEFVYVAFIAGVFARYMLVDD